MKNTIKRLYGVEMVLYIIFVILGLLLLNNPQIEVLRPLAYSSSLFYIITFFSVIVYFSHRNEGDYEFLFLALSSLISGTLIFVNEYNDAANFILGVSVLLFTLINVVNKLYHAYKLTKQKELGAYPKMAIGILIGILGMLVIGNLFNEITMQTLILGYYFTAYGAVCICEPLMMIFLKNEKLQLFFINIMSDEDEKPKPKEINKKVTSKKKTVNRTKTQTKKLTPKKSK